MARAEDGRVVFVRHALPGERVVATITSATSSFLRADAVEVLESVARPGGARRAPHAGPGRCGGCDWQHVALPAQRRLKAALVAEQLRRLARVDRRGRRSRRSPGPRRSGAGGPGCSSPWTGRAGSGSTGTAPTTSSRSTGARSPPATSTTSAWARSLWTGARQVEVTASPDGGRAGGRRGHRSAAAWRPAHPPRPGWWSTAGRADGPTGSISRVEGHRFEVSAGVFWQVHPAAGRGADPVRSSTGLDPATGERVADLYAGAGLFTVPAGPRRRTPGFGGGRGAQRPGLRRRRAQPGGLPPGRRSSDPTVGPDGDRRPRPDRPGGARTRPAQGAGVAVMAAPGRHSIPAPRRMAYVSCDPASFARDLRVVLDAGWSLGSLAGLRFVPHDRARGAGGDTRAPGPGAAPGGRPRPGLTRTLSGASCYSRPVRRRVGGRGCWLRAAGGRLFDGGRRPPRPRGAVAGRRRNPRRSPQQVLPPRRLRRTSTRPWG